MRQRKIAISLAVIGAIAAPFVFHTYKMDPVLWRVVPFTTEGKEKAAAWVADHCEGITEEPPPFVQQLRWQVCLDRIQDLKRGGEEHAYSSTLMYFVINAGAAAAAFVIIYGLTFLLPALARRYWRWLNT
jgi:hypothetical protein